MAQTIKLKRSNTAGNLPTTSSLALGEVAINTKDGKLFLRKHVDGTDSGDAITMYAPQGLNTFGTQTYTVKVDSKSAAHPQNGTGSSNGYFIDGLESPFILLIPGNTYKFDQADTSNSGHPLRFYLEEDKTTAYTTGVTTNGTAGSSGAYTQIAVTTTTPQILYYQCSSHAYMGSGAYAITDAIAANAVTATQIAANSVTTSELATDAVETLNITDANVTEAKLATGAVTTNKIGANAVTSAKIATNAVGSTEIAQNSILTKHIDDNQVGIDQLNVTDGTSGQALTTDGAGTLSFSTVASSLSGASDTSITSPSSGQILVYDGTNSFDNVSISGDATLDNAGALTIATNAITSTMIAQNSILTKHIDDNQVGIDQLNVTDGTSGQVLTTDGAGTLSFSTVSSGSASDSFKTIAISGQSNVVADSSTDTLTLAAGTGITLTTNASTDTITITGTTGLSANSVTATEIATGAVGPSELAATTVTAGSYTNTDITVDADGRITAASNGTSSGLSANSVTATEIATGAVGASELAATGVSAGTYGSATAVPQVVVDADGRLTSVSNVTISGGGGGGGVGLNQTISQFSTTGDGSTTAFNTSVTISNENLTWIFIDGVYQQKGSYSTNASTVTFSAAPPNGATIEVMILESITTGGAFGHNSFNGDGSTTDFTLGQTPTGEGDVIAFIDGVYQNQDSFTLSGSDIQFDTAPSNNTKVIVYVVGGVVTGKTQIVDTFSGSTLISAGSPYNCTLSINPIKEENTNVYIGGVYQPKSTYSVSGTTLTLDAAPPSGTNNIEVVIGQVTTTTDVGANAVNSAAIATNAVGSTEIAQNSILTKHIDDAQVTADQLASDAVTTAKILDANVTTAKIADNAITSAKIASNTILASELAQNILTASEITRLIPDGTDVAFDGTTFVVDASANRVGIGTSGPSSPLDVRGGNIYVDGGGTGGASQVILTTSASSGSNFGQISNTGTRWSLGYGAAIGTVGTEVLTWNSSGNVGIGEPSPGEKLVIKGTTSFMATNSTNRWMAYTYTDNTFRLNYNGSGADELTIDSSGNVGIGTDSPAEKLHIRDSSTNADVYIKIANDSRDWFMGVEGSNSDILSFKTHDASNLLNITSSGKVGIGTDSPTAKLTIYNSIDTTYSTSGYGATPANSMLYLNNTHGGSNTASLINFRTGSGDGVVGFVEGGGTNDADFVIQTDGGSNGVERLRITNDGKVGIGNSNPTTKLNTNLAVEGSLLPYMSGTSLTFDADANIAVTHSSSALGTGTAAGLLLANNNNSNSAPSPLIAFSAKSALGNHNHTYATIHGEKSSSGADNNWNTGALVFSTGSGTGPNERMRIDSSGNVLVGTTQNNPTSSGVNVAGQEFSTTGGVRSTVASNPAATFNRKTDDGDVVIFRKDGSTVGSIGVEGSELTIGHTTAGLQFLGSEARIRPFNMSNNAATDNTIDLGRSNSRFNDIYATNGTINTSDRNEKQDIEALTDAETRVAVAAKGLLRKFRWKSAVEEKGDEARIHFGIIAQDLQDAFTAEGLDAGDYAMFISDTWTDEDGVEQTRLGVRYSELLAFIIAAI